MSARYAALLRGVNLGGNRLVASADLRGVCEKLGFARVQSLLQSGNLVFECDERSAAELERLLEAETERRLGVRTDYHVRRAAEWREIVARNPFREEAERDPARLMAVLLKDAPDREATAALEAAIVGPERAKLAGRTAYIVYPDGSGRSKLTAAVIDRALRTRGTARNWNTVLKIGALLGDLSA